MLARPASGLSYKDFLTLRKDADPEISHLQRNQSRVTRSYTSSVASSKRYLVRRQRLSPVAIRPYHKLALLLRLFWSR